LATPFSDMNALQKIGLVLQNTADPSTLGRYQQQIMQQEEMARQQAWQQKQQERQLRDWQMEDDRTAKFRELAPQLGTMPPQQALSALAAIDSKYADNLLNYNIQQSDPLRKLQLQEANLGIQSKQQEMEKAKNLANLFSNPMFDPDGPEGPEQARKLSPLEMLQRAAALDQRYGDVYLNAELQAAKGDGIKMPEGVNLPPGYMPQFENGKLVGAVPIPGLQSTSTPKLPSGVDLPEGYMPQFNDQGQLIGAAPIPGILSTGAVGGGKLTDGQANAATFAERMAAAEQRVQPFEGVLTSASQNVRANIPLLGNFLASPEYQVARQAQEDWVTANLRKESGAVIGDGEMDREIKKYFPQPGDSKEVISSKLESRGIAAQGMRRAAGPALSQDSTPKVASSKAPTNVIKVSSAEEFARLPSGSTFIAPDGSIRRKP
jgi:hypothetical protein